MTQKHTPGPWAIYPQPISSKADAILESIEQVQATENIADHIYLIDAGGKCAAIAGCGPTSEANARLIAAAPDLLEALKKTLAFIDDNFPIGSHAPGINHVMGAAETAIAKAEGGEA